jgi:putative ABC transport system permease protein
MMSLLQDLRYGFRTLRKNPLFALAAIVTLALGIGATTAIFTLVRGVLLRPQPYAQADRIVALYESPLAAPRKGQGSPRTFHAWQAQTKSFSAMAMFDPAAANLTGEGEPVNLHAAAVSEEFFKVFNLKPLLGRTFRPEEQIPGQHRVVLLSEGVWRTRFGSDPNIVGRTIALNDRPLVVIGVMPRDFQMPSYSKLWVPMALPPQDHDWPGRGWEIFAVLKPGVTLDQAQAEMNVVARNVETQFPDSHTGWGAKVGTLPDYIAGEVRPTLIAFSVAVGLLLLIACANVSNLELTWAANHTREFAVRAALGASRIRILQQIVAQSLVLSAIATLLGLGMARFVVRAVIAAFPDDLPRVDSIRMDLGVFAFAALIAILTAFLFGALPALRAASLDLLRGLKNEPEFSVRRFNLRDAIIAGEIALTLVMLIGAGLLTKTLFQLLSVNPGFEPTNVLTMRIDLPSSRYPDAERQRVFFDNAVQAAANVPGVISAGASTYLPLDGLGSATSFTLPDRPLPKPGQEPDADVRFVTPGYLQTVGVPLRAGRLFTAADSGSKSLPIVINQTLAKKYWPGEDPVGKRINMEWGEVLHGEVVGVVGDVRLTNLDKEADSTIYWLHSSTINNSLYLAVKTEGDPDSVASAVIARIHDLDANLPVAKVRTLEQIVSKSVLQPRFSAITIGLFATTALLLSAIGLYGVIAYSVTQRRREIGIRLALGAQRKQILGLVLMQGARVAAIGALIGLTAALAVNRMLRSLLFQVAPTDLPTYVAIAFTLMSVALLACYFPARRAAKVDPMVALRYE